MGAFTLTTRDGVARLSLDVAGESVNTISASVRIELADMLKKVEADPSIKAVVFISGKPETFIAGADIDEFARLSTREEALRLVQDGQGLIQRLASLSKPVVAAIHGTCLGGGLEAVLACRYRVATDHPKTALGLPEVQLGIIPAAGGCQRLPRLIGMRAALDIILAGKTVPARRAHRLGIVDELVHPAILESVADIAARRLASGWRPTRRRPSLVEWALDRNPLGRLLVAWLAKRAVRAKTGAHFPAPLTALRAVARGLNRGLQSGREFEAQSFADLAVSNTSRKLVQIFFATRSLRKDAGARSTGAAVNALGVIGAGFMGSAIAGVAVTQAGVDVRMKDADPGRVAIGIAGARRIIEDRLKRKRITRWEFQRLTALVSGGANWGGFRRVGLVIEAVFEDLAVKRGVFRDLEDNTSDDCILASNTSTIPITSIAEGARLPGRIVGMHFFSPVDRMPLLEVIAGKETSEPAVQAAAAFGHRMGKTVIVVRDRPGFWINRILAPFLNEAARLVSEGVPITRIDRALRRFGFPVGPLTLLDEVGLDVSAKASQVLHHAFGARLEPVAGMKKLIDAGRLGRKNGRGFYDYRAGRRGGASAEARAILDAHAAVLRSNAPGVETRLVFAMLNEAVLALDEGVVRSPRDGDIGAVFGIGFPAFLGGPLRYLDDIGAAAALATLERLQSTCGDRFTPAPLIVSMARKQGRFYPNG